MGRRSATALLIASRTPVWPPRFFSVASWQEAGEEGASMKRVRTRQEEQGVGVGNMCGSGKRGRAGRDEGCGRAREDEGTRGGVFERECMGECIHIYVMKTTRRLRRRAYMRAVKSSWDNCILVWTYLGREKSCASGGGGARSQLDASAGFARRVANVPWNNMPCADFRDTRGWVGHDSSASLSPSPPPSSLPPFPTPLTQHIQTSYLLDGAGGG